MPTPLLVPAPLAGVNPLDYLAGGYAYLQQTNEANPVYHPGVDLNAGAGGQADCGRLITARCAGVVRHVGYHVSGSGKGFGWHAWIEADGGAGWPHLCHQAERPWVAEGQRVAPETVVGRCGATAGWPFCHTHFEVMRARPPDWGVWVSGLSRAQVAARYDDPIRWLNERATDAPPGDEDEEEGTVGVRATDEEIKAYLEQLGVGVSWDTAIVGRAAQAFRRGETRGPAVSGEYAAPAPDGRPVIRQRFTAGIAEYNPATGEVGWVEVVLHPEPAAEAA